MPNKATVVQQCNHDKAPHLGTMLTLKLCVASALIMTKSPPIMSGMWVKTNSEGSVNLYVGATVVGGTFCTVAAHISSVPYVQQASGERILHRG